LDAQIHSGEINFSPFFEAMKTMKEQKTEDIHCIDRRVRICVECGSISVSRDDSFLNCLQCGKKFKFKGVVFDAKL
jgi:ribosomal protein L37AE/L43A